MAFFGRQMSNIAMNLRSAPSPIAYPVGIDVGSGIIEPKLPRTNVGNFRLRSRSTPWPKASSQGPICLKQKGAALDSGFPNPDLQTKSNAGFSQKNLSVRTSKKSWPATYP